MLSVCVSVGAATLDEILVIAGRYGGFVLECLRARYLAEHRNHRHLTSQIHPLSFRGNCRCFREKDGLLYGDSDKFIDAISVVNCVAIAGNVPKRFYEVCAAAIARNVSAREVDQLLAQLRAERSIAQVGSAHA